MNAKFQIDPQGWVHLSPIGEFPWNSVDGKKSCVQVVDNAALNNFLNVFQGEKRELLLDYDHESYDVDKRTTAAGWIHNMEVRNDGLWGQVRWSEQGLKDAEGGQFRFISPTFALNWESPLNVVDGIRRIRPSFVLDAALTNRPNLRGIHPISNREVAASKNNQQNKGVTVDYKAQLLKLLGLDAGATDQQIEEAIAKFGQASQAATNKITELTASLAQRDEQIKTFNAQRIERDLDEHGIEGDSREPWRKVLASNREDGLKALSAMPKTNKSENKGITPLHNRNNASTPSNDNRSLGQKQEAAIAEVRAQNKCTHIEAFAIAKNKNPEIFKEES